MNRLTTSVLLHFFLVLALGAGLPILLLGQKKKSAEDTLVYEITPAPFNTPYSDYSPVFYKNGVVFTSNRINYLGVKYTSQSGLPLTDLFFAEPKSGGKWKGEKPLPGAINTIYNDGPCTFNNEGTIMFFNRNYEEKELQSKLKILKAELVEGEWKNVSELSFNSPSYSCIHPSVSPSGNKFYFASDMAGGFGGMDLYYTENKEDKWTKPTNLGPEINSSGNDVFPFINWDGTLYFSSDGHGGLGGLEIFSVKKGKEGWEKPVNLGLPFNSPLDDFGFVRDSSNVHGFFSSNRRSAENDDIYEFKLKQPAFKTCPLIKQNNYCVTLSEETTRYNDTIPYVYEWEIEGQIIKGKVIKHCFKGPGNYAIKLNVTDPFLDVTYPEEAFYTLEILDEEQVFITSRDTVTTGTEVLFSGNKSNLPGCKITKYFWSFGDGHFKNGETVKHVFDKPGTYIIRLGVEGDLPDSGKTKACESCVLKSIVVREK